MHLEFGIWDHFEQQDPERVPLTQQYEERIQLIVEAERLGFSRYHVAEHNLTPLDMAPSPNVFLAAVARQTSRIRFGSMVLCLPLYHPVRLLQEICMLDHLSGGRLEPGVGRGVRDIEHEWFGLDAMQARDRYSQAQRPLPPMWYAGTIQSAARQGMNGLGRRAWRAYGQHFFATDLRNQGDVRDPQAVLSRR